jgi:hypothetical protein
MAASLGGLAYFLMGILVVYSFVKGIFTVWTWNIRVENYRSGPLLLQLIGAITEEDEPENIREYPYDNIKRLMQYVDAKVGVRNNEAGLDLLRGKKD